MQTTDDRMARDIDRIRRGLALAADLAADATPRPRVRRRAPHRAVGVAAAALLLAGATAVVVGGVDDDASDAPVAAPPATDAGPVLNSSLGPQTVAERVALADAVVVGTVRDVAYGELDDQGGLPYALATIDVAEWVKGPSDRPSSVVAFDYAFAGPTSAGDGSGWVPGQQVLVFLVSDAGTVSESIQPAHLQVAGGPDGRFAFDGDRLVAPFTLDEVRQAATGG
ncbi:MAG TPA: hypothetical protein VM618_02675 [Acidimicrobiia bacterium]|nr:hypothetical protein [Acidimicrobiia bacterium]